MMGDVDSIYNNRSINFQKRGADKNQSTSNIQIKACSEVEESSDSYVTSTDLTSTNSNKVDSIKSCESILKIFSFDARGFSKRNEKCLEFWNVINSRSDIQPVDCLIMDANNNKKDVACQTEQQESQASLWARALHLLRKRNVDRAALAVLHDSCNYCRTYESQLSITSEDEVTKLNNWIPYTKYSFGTRRDLQLSDRSSSLSTPASDHKKLDRHGDANQIIEFSSEPTEHLLAGAPATVSSECSAGLANRVSEKKQEPTVTSSNEAMLGIMNFEDEKLITKPIGPTETKISQIVDKGSNIASTGQIEGNRQNVLTTSQNYMSEDVQNAIIGKLSEAVVQLEVEAISGSSSLSSNLKKEGKLKKSDLTVKLPSVEEERSFIGELNPSQHRRMTKDERKKLRDNFNYAQNVFSLLEINGQEYYKATAAEKKKLLQDALKKNYSKLFKREPKDEVRCPCTLQLKEFTQSNCECKEGFCKPHTELTEEQIAEASNAIPFGPGIECFRYMLQQLNLLKKKNLTSAQISVELKNILQQVQNRELGGKSCNCALHKIDLERIKQEAREVKLVKDTLSDNVSKTLDKKHRVKLNISDVNLENKMVDVHPNSCSRILTKSNVGVGFKQHASNFSKSKDFWPCCRDEARVGVDENYSLNQVSGNKLCKCKKL